MSDNNVKKDNKTTMILTTLVCLIPVIAGIILYSHLPDQIVTHWDDAGNPNGWSSKFVGAIVFPGILVLVNLLMVPLMKMDPKYANVDNKIKSLILWIIPAVSLFCAGTTLAAGMGVHVNITLICPMFIGLIFIMIGNYLPKTKQSYMVGIKLPWTLDSEENWNKTHRMAGFIWMLGGLLIIVASFFSWKKYVIPAIGLMLVLVPTVYSYLMYIKGKSEN